MQVKKWFVSLLAVVVSTAAFALTAPSSDDDPMVEALQQYTAQVAQMNKTFDDAILPPLKEMLKIATDFGNSEAEAPTAAQEQAFAQYQEQFANALLNIVNPMIEEINMDQFNELAKQFAQMTGQTIENMTKEDVTDMMVGMTALAALEHFEQTGALSSEEVELALILFFPQEEE